MAMKRMFPAVMGVLLVGGSILLLLAVAALPGLHQPVPSRQGHYESQARQWQAQQARAIIADPQNRCKQYECGTSHLRVCLGETETGEVVHALQWVWFDGTGWQEGTAFLQDKPQKVENYLSNNGCKEVIQ